MIKELTFNEAMERIQKHEAVFGIRFTDGQPETVDLTDIFNGIMFIAQVDDVTVGAPSPKEEREEGVKTRRKKVDHAKVVALYEAGKSAAWIASEMHCSEAAVYRHIKEEEARINGQDDDDAEAEG